MTEALHCPENRADIIQNDWPERQMIIFENVEYFKKFK